MTITLEQHYGIAWLVLLLIVCVIAVIADWTFKTHAKHVERQSRNKIAHLTRYSFNKVSQS